MKTLYIIGNGFDKAHELPTSYADFHAFLKGSRYRNAYDFVSAIKDMVRGVELWSEFERALGQIDPIQFIKYRISENKFDQPAADFVEEANIVCGDISYIQKDYYNELLEAFGDWACHIKTDKACQLKGRHFSPKDLYLTFNYTDTLERVYKIPSGHVMHIHGDANKPGSTIVVGHCHKYEDDAKKISRYLDQHLPGDLGDACDELIKLLNLSQKDVNTIISDNRNYFDDLRSQKIRRIVVTGHSFGEVDWPYFQTIAYNCPDAQWVLECFKEGDKKNARRIDEHLGLCAAIIMTNKNTLSTCFHNCLELIKSYIKKGICYKNRR